MPAYPCKHQLITYGTDPQTSRATKSSRPHTLVFDHVLVKREQTIYGTIISKIHCNSRQMSGIMMIRNHVNSLSIKKVGVSCKILKIAHSHCPRPRNTFYVTFFSRAVFIKLCTLHSALCTPNSRCYKTNILFSQTQKATPHSGHARFQPRPGRLCRIGAARSLQLVAICLSFKSLPNKQHDRQISTFQEQPQRGGFTLSPA